MKGPHENHHRESYQTQNEQETAEAVERASATDGGRAVEVIGRAEFARVGQFSFVAIDETDYDVFAMYGSNVGVHVDNVTVLVIGFHGFAEYL